MSTPPPKPSEGEFPPPAAPPRNPRADADQMRRRLYSPVPLFGGRECPLWELPRHYDSLSQFAGVLDSLCDDQWRVLDLYRGLHPKDCNCVPCREYAGLVRPDREDVG